MHIRDLAQPVPIRWVLPGFMWSVRLPGAFLLGVTTWCGLTFRVGVFREASVAVACIAAACGVCSRQVSEFRIHRTPLILWPLIGVLVRSGNPPVPHSCIPLLSVSVTVNLSSFAEFFVRCRQ